MRNYKRKEIETIQTCKKCGSHNIANPLDFYDLKSKGYDDTYGTIQEYK